MARKLMLCKYNCQSMYHVFVIQIRELVQKKELKIITNVKKEVARCKKEGFGSIINSNSVIQKEDV